MWAGVKWGRLVTIDYINQQDARNSIPLSPSRPHKAPPFLPRGVRGERTLQDSREEDKADQLVSLSQAKERRIPHRGAPTGQRHSGSQTQILNPALIFFYFIAFTLPLSTIFFFMNIPEANSTMLFIKLQNLKTLALKLKTVKLKNK